LMKMRDKQMSAQTQGMHEHDFEESDFEFIAPEEDYTTEPNISTANIPVSTAGAEVSTTSPEVKTAASQIEDDEKLAHRLQAQERERYCEADKTTMKRVNTFTPMKSDDTVPKVAAGSSKIDAE
ncbi:hypothetical protein Tco_1573984, partial [Tanacetum coccineum]